MTFGVLGAISAAIAEGATAAMVATGLGTAAGAGASAGLLSAGTTAALAGGLGTVGTGALVGSGLGAAGSAIMGEDPGKGAMFGALGGGLTGGLGSLAGAGTGSAASGAAGSSIGEAALQPTLGEAFNASNVMGQGSLLASAPTSATTSLTGNIGSQFTQGIGSNIAASGAQTGGGGILSSIPSGVTDFVKSQAPSMLVDTLGSFSSPTSAGGPSVADMNVQNYVENKDAQDLARRQYGAPLGGGKLGSRYAEGGEINLEDGQWIIPADVVSALGNGSTKAGAQFLDEFFGLA